MPTVKRKTRPPTEWVKERPGTQMAWGYMPGTKPASPQPAPDDADEIVVGGLRLVRGPDGNLYGLEEPKATS
jgi:hypothetical protein